MRRRLWKRCRSFSRRIYRKYEKILYDIPGREPIEYKRQLIRFCAGAELYNEKGVTYYDEVFTKIG